MADNAGKFLEMGQGLERDGVLQMEVKQEIWNLTPNGSNCKVEISTFYNVDLTLTWVKYQSNVG